MWSLTWGWVPMSDLWTQLQLWKLLKKYFEKHLESRRFIISLLQSFEIHFKIFTKNIITKKCFFFRIFRNIWNIQKKLRIHYREHSNKDKQFLTNFFLSNKEYSNGDTFFQRPIIILGSLFLAIWKTKKVWQATKDTT